MLVLIVFSQAEATGAAEDPGDDNNNPPGSLVSGGETNIDILSATSAASVGEFYRKLQGSQGKVLGRLLRGEICLGENASDVDYSAVLEELSQVCNFLADLGMKMNGRLLFLKPSGAEFLCEPSGARESRG